MATPTSRITSSHHHTTICLVPQVHGSRSTAGHGPDTYALAQRPPASTPPFSYCEDFASARPAGVETGGSPFRLSQPLVSFSPPFEPPFVDPRGHGGAVGEQIGGIGAGESPSLCTDTKVRHESSEVACKGPLASLGLLGTASASPGLLETLPESPFSWKGRAPDSRPQNRPDNNQPPTVADHATPARRPASGTSPLTPGRLTHATPLKAAGIDPSEVRVGCDHMSSAVIWEMDLRAKILVLWC